MDRIETPPDVVIRRLPLYARSLRYLLQEDIRSVSSQELGERINVTAAQIRKDLSYFGEFAKQRHGPTGTVPMGFQGEFTRFFDLAEDSHLPERFE